MVSIIEVLDKLPGNEFLTIDQLANRVGVTVASIRLACACGPEWIVEYQYVTKSMGVGRKKIFGSKKGIKAIEAHLENETARSRS